MFMFVSQRNIYITEWRSHSWSNVCNKKVRQMCKRMGSVIRFFCLTKGFKQNPDKEMSGKGQLSSWFPLIFWGWVDSLEVEFVELANKINTIV